VNDPAATELVLATGEHYFGRDHIYGAASMGAEDMALYLQKRPGCYFWLGARNDARGIVGRHHDSGFMIDEAALPLGVEFAVRVLERSLTPSA
jgi:amidohydrolase